MRYWLRLLCVCAFGVEPDFPRFESARRGRIKVDEAARPMGAL